MCPTPVASPFLSLPRGTSELPATSRSRTPPFIRRCTRIFLIVILILPIALLAIPWQQNVRGEGTVIAFAPLQRQQSVEAQISGVVKEWFVNEGSHVAPGDPICSMSDVDPFLLDRLQQRLQQAELQRDSKQRAVADYQQQISDLQRQYEALAVSWDQTLEATKQKVKEHEQKLRAATAKVDFAETKFATVSQLHDRGLRSQLEYQGVRADREQSLAEKESAVAALEGARSDLLAKASKRSEELQSLRSKISATQAKVNSTAADLAKAESDVVTQTTTLSRQRAQDVKAPFAGIIVRLLVNAGAEQVSSGTPVALIVPDTEELAVELWVDGNDMPWLDLGRKARLQFEGWPAVQFGTGWPSRAIGTFGGVVTLVDASADNLGRFRVLVRPDPDDDPWPVNLGDSSQRLNFLRQGVRAKGWILLEEVSLGFELWRQLNGFPPILPTSEKQPSGSAK